MCFPAFRGVRRRLAQEHRHDRQRAATVSLTRFPNCSLPLAPTFSFFSMLVFAASLVLAFWPQASAGQTSANTQPGVAVWDRHSIKNALQEAESHLGSGRYIKAVEVLNGIPERLRDSYICNMLGAAHYQAGQIPDAETAFQRAIQLDPQDYTGYYNLGRILAKFDSRETALQLLEKARSLAPQSVPILSALGTTYHLTGRIQEARVVFKDLLKLHPESTDPYELLGSSHLDSGEVQEALTYLVHAQGLPNTSAKIHYLLGLAYFDLGYAGQGEFHLKEAIRLDAGYCQAYFQLAKRKLSEGNPSAALAEARKAVQCDPEDPAAHYQLSQIHRRLGDLENARAEASIFENLRRKKHQ